MTRFLSGQKPSYKPIDYEQIAAYSKIRSSSAKHSLQKIEKLQEGNKQKKNVQIIQEHRRIWENETRRLKSAEMKIENEILALQPSNQNFERPATAVEELYEDISDIQDSLRLDMTQFIKNTLHPVHDLRDDLQEWIQSNKSKLALGYHETDSENDIAETLKSVKRQQAIILTRLKEEQKSLEDSLQELMAVTGLMGTNGAGGDVTHRSDSTLSSEACSIATYSTTSTRLPTIVVGVPNKIARMECPDDGLKESCFEEFDSLDEKYVSAIEALEDKYKDVIERLVRRNLYSN